MRAALACLAVGSLLACGGGKGGAVATKPKGPVGPAIDADEAKQGASDLVEEIYGTLGRGNKDSLFTLLDDSLIVFGPRSTDMLGTRTDALVALDQVVDPRSDKTLAIKPGKLEVAPAPGGRSAWVVDTATFNGQPHTVMAVLTNAADLWLVEAVAIARAPAAAQVKAELAKDAVVPPGMTGPQRVDPDARLAVDKFRQGLLDQAAWGAELESHDDAIVVGPTAGEVARGKKAIQAMWKKRVDAGTRAVVVGDLTASVTDDGQLAWVSAPITRVEGDSTQPLPLRAFAVYEQGDGDWKLIALHESLALGEPGAGARFKNIVPPRPAEPKPPEVIADKPADKDKSKSKSKSETAKVEPKAKAKVEPKAKAKVAADPPKRKPPEEEPRPKAKVKQAKADDAEEQPKKKLAKADVDPPKKKAKTKADEEEEEEEQPKKKAKVKQAKADDEEEEEQPKKKAKAKAKAKADEDEGEEERPKKKKRTFADLSRGSKADREEDEQPQKKDKAMAKADVEEEEQPK